MSKDDLRPPVWVGHVLLETYRLKESAAFMRKIGLRPIVEREQFAVLEMRGGTHLVLIAKPTVTAGDPPVELMGGGLQATPACFTVVGLAPTPSERLSREHEQSKLRDPAGHLISFVSNHTSGQPV